MYVVPYCVYFLKVLLLPFTKVLGQNYELQNDSLHTSNEMEVVLEFSSLAQKGYEITPQKKFFLGPENP